MYFKEDVRESSDDYMRTYNVMRLGDIAFEGNKSKNFSHGRFVENTIGDGIVSHVFDVFRPIMEYDLLFWKYLINNDNVMGRIMTRCTKASTMMTNLVAKDFFNEDILIPQIDEQSNIGEYIDKIDHIITLYQRKCDDMKTLKKCMLQKMFPKKNENIPEIRFDGFNEPWEQRKLEDICVKITDGSHFSPIEVDNGYPMPSVKDMLQDGFNLNSSKKISKEDYELLCKQGCKPEIGDVVVAKDGSILKYAFEIRKKQELVILSSIAIMRPNQSLLNGKFLAQHITKPDFKERIINENTTGTGVPRILLSNFKNVLIFLPSKEEQSKIGEYFNYLDNLITLHQRKCDEMKEIKKFMLNNMFPRKG